jgi:phage shock protein A
LEISSGKTKNLILELEAKLETYQSKCAQAESSLNQLKCHFSEKDEQISQFQQQVQMLEAKSLQAHSLADALQRRLDDVKTGNHNLNDF